MSSSLLRKGRFSGIGTTYVVTTVVLRRQPLFADPALAGIVRSRLRQSDAEGASQTHAWVLMPDHLHWLFTLRGGGLSACVGRFKARSAHALNRARGQVGAVWQDGFHDHGLRNDEDLRAHARYIMANPLRAGLVADIRDYPHWGCRWVSREQGLDGW